MQSRRHAPKHITPPHLLPHLSVRSHHHDRRLLRRGKSSQCISTRQVYSLHTSMDAVVKFLEKVDPERATKAKQRYSCFDKWALRCTACLLVS